MGKEAEAIAALDALLAFSPTDAEGWSELSDLHLSQGHYAQAIFALEEVLVLVPNAWNVSVACCHPTLLTSGPQDPRSVG
jgi:cytochrome c-type biogenesis protein CcmH/NrfG